MSRGASLPSCWHRSNAGQAQFAVLPIRPRFEFESIAVVLSRQVHSTPVFRRWRSAAAAVPTSPTMTTSGPSLRQALEPKGASDEASRSGAGAVGSWNRDNGDNPGPGRTEPDPSYGNAIQHPSARILGILRSSSYPGRFAFRFGKSPGHAGLFSCRCFTILTLFSPRCREGLAIHG
jgi:hypothetical protein